MQPLPGTREAPGRRLPPRQAGFRRLALSAVERLRMLQDAGLRGDAREQQRLLDAAPRQHDSRADGLSQVRGCVPPPPALTPRAPRP